MSKNIMQNIALGFQYPEKTNKKEFFIYFLDKFDELDSVRVCKQQMLNFLDIKIGHRILDVGCGVGHEVQRIQQLVGDDSLVVGVDKSEAMIKEAKKRADKLNLQVKYYIGDINSLNMNDNSFDACRAERILLYVSNPKKAVSEMIRVLAPSGKLAIFEFDLDGISINSTYPTLTRKIVSFISDSFPNGSIGCKLPEIFEELKMSNIAVIPHSIMITYEVFMLACYGVLEQALKEEVLSESELYEWVKQLEQVHKNGQFFAEHPGFIVTGTKS
ncbi:MAG: methyltransferase domain-containing protein [Nostoc sp.]|uniref:methyltransferase domain-containing protein n=1 Tax=Nostoc sp. TaxID=1180 RepID=UPI002FF9EE64